MSISFPVDKTVVLSQLDASSTTSPSHTTGMPYVPFCTPRKGGPRQPAPASSDHAKAITFSPGEVEGFQILLKESTDSQTVAGNLLSHKPEASKSVSHYSTTPNPTCTKKGTPALTKCTCAHKRTVHTGDGRKGGEKEREAGREGEEKGRVREETAGKGS